MAQLTTTNTGETKRTYGDYELDYAQERYAEFLNFIGGARSESTDIGSAFYWEVPLYSSWSVGVTSEGGVFNETRGNSSINPYVNLGQLVGMYSTSLMYDQVVRGKGAFVDGKERLRLDVLNDVMSLADRYIAGCSGDGKLATVDTTANSASQVMRLPYGDLLLEQGMPIQYHDGDSTQRDAYEVITSIVKSTRTITHANAVSTTAADGVYFSLGATAGGTFGLSTHINGLGNLVSDTGTVHNINRATAGNEAWKSQVFSYGGVLRDYDDGLLHSAFAQTKIATKAKAGTAVDHLISNEGMLYQYNKANRTDRRIANAGDGIASANTGVNLTPVFYFGDQAIPWRAFTHIKPRTIYGIAKSQFRRFGKARPTIMSGSELGISSNSRTTTTETFLVWFLQIALARMNQNFRVDDISDPVLCGSSVGGTDV